MSILSSRYGMTRPRAVTAMLQAAQAALPALPIVEAQERAPWVSLHPRERETHLKAQRRFYAAVNAAGLPTAMAPRLAGINALLDSAFTSSTQLSPDELHTVANAVEAGLFAADWSLSDEAPLPEAPPESEELPDTGTTPAPLETLDVIAMEFDLAQMRAADRARALNALRSERVLLAQKLAELDRALLCA